LRASRHWPRSLAMLLLGWQMMASPALAAAWQVPEPAVEIGAPPILEQAWSFVGQSQAAPDLLIIAGRLTGVSGLAPATLSASPGNDTEPSSRFTFVAELAASDESSRGDTVTTTGDGLLTVYLHDGSALDDTDPATFRAGTVVAEFAIEFQNSALPQAPDLGVVAGTMSLTQTGSFTFTLDEVRYRFGHAGLELALRYTGGLIAGGSDGTPAARIFGAAAVSRRAASPTDTGEASTSAGAELSECELLLAWINGTRSRLAIATTFRTDILSGDVVRFDDLVTAATGVAALVDVQRAQAAPDEASGAERLALAALSTDARGLELLVSAVEAEDEAGETQAVAILADGAALSERALLALDEITPVCEPTS
jgi:hypothetical protein